MKSVEYEVWDETSPWGLMASQVAVRVRLDTYPVRGSARKSLPMVRLLAEAIREGSSGVGMAG